MPLKMMYELLVNARILQSIVLTESLKEGKREKEEIIYL